MSFENMQQRLPSVLENKLFLQELAEKIRTKVDRYRPDPEDFRDVYKNSVDSDLKFVEDQEAYWRAQSQNMGPEKRAEQERMKDISDITESILIDRLSGSWLNTQKKDSNYQVNAHPTCKLDDYKNGVDLVLEVIDMTKEQASHLGLSVDVTFAAEEKILDRKINKIVKEIKNGLRPQVKYFESTDGETKGSVDIARCVLAISKKTVEDLFKLEKRSEHEKLEQHPVQISLVEQIKAQALFFLEMSETYGNQRLVETYSEILKNIDELETSRENSDEPIQVQRSTLKETYKGLSRIERALADVEL